MIAIDTNLLVYCHRRDSPWFPKAQKCIVDLAEDGGPWCIPWPCIHEFLAIVTHPKIYSPATPLEAALAQVDFWMESPTLRLLSEETCYWAELRSKLRDGQISGPTVHDARIAAICGLHGVREFWSADRDFSRFPSLRTKNPLI